ncbi:MAG: hypothetical protein ABI559_02585 [Chloroflexota bacterium]
MSEALPGLRLVVAWSDRRNLCSMIGDDLRGLAGDAEVHRLGDDAFVVHAPLSADALRDHLRPHLTAEDEGLLVIDFEVWSGYGKALNAKWLLARGH